MDYKDFGLINTKKVFSDALSRHYAIPAFNFYNMETLSAIMNAAHDTKSPVILAVSESALKYMGEDLLRGMIWGLNLKDSDKVTLHLDHGSSFESCVNAIKLGFSSVMIDGSKLPFDANVALAKQVADYASKYDVSVEAELGVLSGIEDENTNSKESSYTNPDDVVNFVNSTGIDSLAIAIGTSHGAYKFKGEAKLRFDILKEIKERIPNTPIVLHGASTVIPELVDMCNQYGGNIPGAKGVPDEILHEASMSGVSKINVDTDLRLAMTAAIRKVFTEDPSAFDPRKYLKPARDLVKETVAHKMKDVFGSANKA